MKQRERHVSEGNACLLVVVDSAGPYWERSIVDETILVALEHFGMPYRVLDLARARPAPEALDNCAAIVLAQNGVVGCLSGIEASAIEDAVRRGVGLVNLDYDIRQLEDPLLGIFGCRPTSGRRSPLRTRARTARGSVPRSTAASLNV